jgi:hypothetical protein
MYNIGPGLHLGKQRALMLSVVMHNVAAPSVVAPFELLLFVVTTVPYSFHNFFSGFLTFRLARDKTFLLRRRQWTK